MKTAADFSACIRMQLKLIIEIFDLKYAMPCLMDKVIVEH